MRVRTMTHRLGLERREFKLGWIAFAAAGPHARPLTFSLRWFFLTTFTARIVYTCTESDGEVKLRATTAPTASTSLGAFETATAVTAAATLTWFTPGTTTTPFFLNYSCNRYHATCKEQHANTIKLVHAIYLC